MLSLFWGHRIKLKIYNMRTMSICLILFLIVVQSCSKPKATVFKDERLAQEAMVKFCLLGDLGRETEHQQVIADALEREKCHRIFFLGDLVYPKGITSADDPELERRFMTYYRPLVEEDPNLIINLVLGNHDHKEDPAAWRDVSKRNEAFFFPWYYYMIDYGGLCMVALDTSFYYYTAKVSEAAEQAVWLTELQPRLKDCDIKIALTHHPLKGGDYSGSMDWNGADGELKGFLETFIIGKFDMHITGHVHVLADDGKDDGTHMLISGTGGEVLGDGRAGYIVLRWEPQNPKRIGYSLRYVDTQVNVVDDSGIEAQTAKHEDQEDDIIRKSRVEKGGWFSNFMNQFK